MKTLADYSINRHYPELNKTDNKYLSFFAAVCDKQASLVAKWMGLGFIHGVMNTDNMTISGETIDYGPCAFMDSYNPSTVFSSIDTNGRYAYQNQPAILVWNLAKLAEALMPLIDENEKKSIKQLNEVLQLVMPSYQEYFYKEFCQKLGLNNVNNKNIKLIEDYLKILDSGSIDFTLSFRDLSKIINASLPVKDSVFAKNVKFNDWYLKWKKEINQKEIFDEMDLINTCYIPRNHLIENALIKANEGDTSEINFMINLFEIPYLEKNISKIYLMPSSSEEQYVTFCGT